MRAATKSRRELHRGCLARILVARILHRLSRAPLGGIALSAEDKAPGHLTISSALAKDRSRLSEGEFLPRPSSQNVAEPPPSRFIASLQPSCFMNAASSAKLMPMDKSF